MCQSKPDDERRKIQFTGGSTYIISLPKKWIAFNQLKKGSYIKLREEEDGLLTIVPPDTAIQGKPDGVTIKTGVNEDSEYIIRKIVSLYLAGYNSIYVKSDRQQFSAKQRQDIKSFVRRMLVGTEIVVDTPNQLVLQVLLSYPELTVQSTLRRMSIITKSMHDDAVCTLKTNDASLAKEIVATDNEVDRFNLYITRLLKMAIQNPRISKDIGLPSGKDCLGYLVVTRLVERTADHATCIAENYLAMKAPLDAQTVELTEKMSRISVSMFDTAMESLFREDYNSAEKIIESLKEVAAIENQVVTSSLVHSEDQASLRLIVESIRRTAEYACDIAEMVLNLTVETVIV